MIHVAYATSNLYAKFAGTSMLSLFENTKENVTVHIMYDNSFTTENQEKFIQVARRYNQQVKFYNVEKKFAAEIYEMQSIFSAKELGNFPIVVTFWFFLPRLMSGYLDKIIYLDADTVVNLDIKELWSVDLQDKPFAAVVDNFAAVSDKNKKVMTPFKLCLYGIMKPTDYFNSGVMIMNLEKLRQNANIINKETDNPQYESSYRDILNYCFSTQYLKLPTRFNEFVRTEKSEGKNILEPKIYHYIYHYLGFDFDNAYDRIFWKTFSKTPWFNIGLFWHLLSALKDYSSDQENLIKEQRAQLIEFSTFMSGKTRTFLTDITNFEKLKQGFFIKENEEIILLTEDTPVIKLVDSMNALRDKKIFFLLFAQIEIYIALRNLLTERGLIEGKDFINTVPLVIKPKLDPKEISDETSLDQWEIIKNL